MNSKSGTLLIVIIYLAFCYIIWLETKKSVLRRENAYLDHLDKLRSLECYRVAEELTKVKSFKDEKVPTNRKKRKAKS